MGEAIKKIGFRKSHLSEENMYKNTYQNSNNLKIPFMFGVYFDSKHDWNLKMIAIFVKFKVEKICCHQNTPNWM